jgi:putative hydrolase of the HAD superfamily
VIEWQAIVFDMDDTLYPERDYVVSGFRAVAEWIGRERIVHPSTAFLELKNLFDSGVQGNIFDRWLMGHNLPAELVPKMVAVYRNHEPAIAPSEDAFELLDSLSGRYRIGLVTDGYLSVQQRKFAALGLSERFGAVVFSDELGRENWKPSTKPFELVLQRLECRPNRAVYIGDNPLKDFYGARALGMFTLRLRRPNGLHASLEPPSPHHAPHITVASLAEVETAIALP